jgi:hypothetical protein
MTAINDALSQYLDSDDVKDIGAEAILKYGGNFGADTEEKDEFTKR